MQACVELLCKVAVLECSTDMAGRVEKTRAARRFAVALVIRCVFVSAARVRRVLQVVASANQLLVKALAIWVFLVKSQRLC